MTTLNKKDLETLVKEAVKTAVAEKKGKPKEKDKVLRVSKKKLAEGVKAIFEQYSMEMNMQKESDRYHDEPSRYLQTMTFGVLPSDEAMQKAWDKAGGFTMNLQGEDSLVFAIAEHLTDSMFDYETLDGFKKTVMALMNVPRPADVHDENYDLYVGAEKMIQRYDQRYGNDDEYLGDSIPEKAERLASTMMDHLGFEWI